MSVFIILQNMYLMKKKRNLELGYQKIRLLTLGGGFSKDYYY